MTPAEKQYWAQQVGYAVEQIRKWDEAGVLCPVCRLHDVKNGRCYRCDNPPKPLT